MGMTSLRSAYKRGRNINEAGLWRYKRLMFSISSTPEIYQHVIREVLQDIDGVHNISDDNVVFGNTTHTYIKFQMLVRETSDVKQR